MITPHRISESIEVFLIFSSKIHALYSSLIINPRQAQLPLKGVSAHFEPTAAAQHAHELLRLWVVLRLCYIGTEGQVP